MARRIRETTLRIVEAPDPDLTPLPPASRPQAPAAASVLETSGPNIDDNEVEVAPLPVQPDRAHQYFESTPDDFGAWHIFVSSRS